MARLNALLARAWISYFLIGSLSAQAAVPIPQFGGTQERPSDGSQHLPKQSVYVYGDGSLDMLQPVQVLGAVAKAGVHYVPPNTDLITLLSLAGGPIQQADEEKITIRRTVNGQRQVIAVNLQELVGSSDAETPIVMSNDTVVVPSAKPFLSENVVRAVGVVAGLATIFGTLVLGIQNL